MVFYFVAIPSSSRPYPPDLLRNKMAAARQLTVSYKFLNILFSVYLKKEKEKFSY
jgi:hypothetical protein